MSILFRDTCRSIRDKLPLHVGRDLDPKLEKRVDEHLAGCLNCLREYRALAETRAILGVVAEERLPKGVLDGFTEEVMARIAVDEPGPAAELPRAARRTPMQLLPALSAAAALLLVALAARLYFDGEGRVATPDLGGLLQHHDPESRASNGRGVAPRAQLPPNSFTPGAAQRAPSGPRFMFEAPVPQLPPEPGDEAELELETEAERQINEALRRGGTGLVIKLGGLQTVRETDGPRPRDG